LEGKVDAVGFGVSQSADFWDVDVFDAIVFEVVGERFFVELGVVAAAGDGADIYEEGDTIDLQKLSKFL
jgi:hypothetical protein